MRQDDATLFLSNSRGGCCCLILHRHTNEKIKSFDNWHTHRKWTFLILILTIEIVEKKSNFILFFFKQKFEKMMFNYVVVCTRSGSFQTKFFFFFFSSFWFTF
jgi:hypothetical protein